MAKGDELSNAVSRLRDKFNAELERLAAKVKAAERSARSSRTTKKSRKKG